MTATRRQEFIWKCIGNRMGLQNKYVRRQQSIFFGSSDAPTGLLATSLKLKKKNRDKRPS